MKKRTQYVQTSEGRNFSEVQCSYWELSEVAMAVKLVLSLFFFGAEVMPFIISCRMASKVMTGVSDVDVLLGGILSTKDDT
ncbi:hypothetical protein Tco_1563737 [Tanacetum coccineum]